MRVYREPDDTLNDHIYPSHGRDSSPPLARSSLGVGLRFAPKSMGTSRSIIGLWSTLRDKGREGSDINHGLTIGNHFPILMISSG
jgi:hypothetical protein